MQSYLDTFADWRTHKIWKKYKEWYNNQIFRSVYDSDALQDNQPSDDEISSDNMAKLFDKVIPKFYGFILLALANISRKCKPQLFYHTASARFHGLSRHGTDMMARLGFMQKLSLFDKMTKEANEKALADIKYLSSYLCSHDTISIRRSLIIMSITKKKKLFSICFSHVPLLLITHVYFDRDVQSQPHTLWLDNFSKHIKYQFPNLHHGTFKACLWSGLAMKRWNKVDVPLDMAIKYNPDDNTAIPAMPDDPFLFRQQFLDLYAKKEKKTTMYQLESSLVQTWEVNNVPLKPTFWFPIPEKYQKSMKECGSMSNLYPCDLLEQNVGSNEGFFQIFRDVFNERAVADQENPKYNVLFMDCNIYDRLLKVSVIDMTRAVH